MPRRLDWRQSEHASELIVPLLRVRSAESLECRVKRGVEVRGAHRMRRMAPGPRDALAERAGAGLDSGAVAAFSGAESAEALAPELAARLYGPVLRTSVSRMEQFAACPFKFFVHSGLRAEERKLFELDKREQGSFQHDVLALFHEQLRSEQKRWRDITPREARERIARIARSLMASYRDGLLEASEESRFMARVLTESLQDFVETLVGWMREQYQFDPAEVELPFGEEADCAGVGDRPGRRPRPGAPGPD